MKANKYIPDNFTHNTNAAEEILPFIFKLFSPKKVIDVGCGTGTWLKVASELGAEILGFEGPHLNANDLVIDRKFVEINDLEKPLATNLKADLIICLEVAEHLSSQAADTFISSLVSLGDVILFSAAIPNQGGYNHINEQWQQYWKMKFEEHQFHSLDIIRPMFWENDKVEFWYKQNTILYIRDFVSYTEVKEYATFNAINLVHPELYEKINLQFLPYKRGAIPLNRFFKLLGKMILNKFR